MARKFMFLAIFLAKNSFFCSGSFDHLHSVASSPPSIYQVDQGSGFAFEAELATRFFAIEIACEKGWSNLWLESDSTYVVNVLKNRQSLVPWRLLGRWHRIRRLLGDLHFVVSHIYRKGNASADRLTREPVDYFEWWNQVPAFLVPFLNRDWLSEFYRFTL
ncbi:hypothetical protein ACS0TY_007193 [Phlomoides rotata]